MSIFTISLSEVMMLSGSFPDPRTVDMPPDGVLDQVFT